MLFQVCFFIETDLHLCKICDSFFCNSEKGTHNKSTKSSIIDQENRCKKKVKSAETCNSSMLLL